MSDEAWYGFILYACDHMDNITVRLLVQMYTRLNPAAPATEGE